MAIQNVGQGVYVIVPEKVDTQGGKYVSLFTKQREEQWQLAQKQAGFEADLAAKSYAEQMKVYRDRVDAMNDQIRDLRKLRERALSDELTAKDKAELASWKLQADRDAKIAARANKPLPSTTRTETTGTAGRGGKGPTLGKVGDADKEIIMGAMAPAVGDVGTALAGVKDARETTDLAAATPEDTDAQNFFVINDLADKRVLATGEDKDTAIAEVLRESNAIDPQYAESYARHVRTKDEIETGTAGDRKTTTTRTGGGAARVPEYEFGKEGATPKAGPEIPVESREQMQADIDKKIGEIQDEIKGLKAPTFETFDYITRAREIASGRFGPTSPSPAFGQRNALQILLRATPEEQQRYLADFRASPEGQAFLATRTSAAPATPEVTAPAATPAPVETTPVATPATAETSVPTPPPAPVTPPQPAPPIPEAVPVPPVDIRPEAAALMTPDEIAAFKERLAASAAAAQMRRDLAAVEMGGEGISPEMIASVGRLTPPPRLPAPERPQMTPPVGVAESMGAVRVPSGVKPPTTLPSIGRYTPGPGLTPVEREAPSTADVAPRAPAEAPPGYFDRPSRPLSANIAAQMAIREGTEAAETAAAAKKTMTDIEKAGALDTFRGPEKVRETKQTYLLNRLDTAYSLVKKPSKLDRVIASGPGKVAYDLYVANKSTGKPFSKTYEMLTIEFAGDRSLMEQAHAVALALDIKDSNTAPGGVK